MYVCIQVYIAPIRARVARKNVTKMTKARKALSFQHVIMVMHMTNIWPSDDHVYIQYASVNATPQHMTKMTMSTIEWQLSLCKHVDIGLHSVQFTFVYIGWHSGGGLGLGEGGKSWAGITQTFLFFVKKSQTFFYFKNVLQKILCLKACHTSLVK